MTDDSIDILSKAGRILLAPLLTHHAARMSVGLLIGIFTFGGLNAAHLQLPWSSTLAGGVLIAFVPLLWQRKPPALEEHKVLFDILDEVSRRSGLTVAQKRLAYLTISKKLVDGYNPEHPLPKSMAQTAEDVVAEVKGLRPSPEADAQ